MAGRWALVILVSLLPACAGGTGLYDKPGLTYAEWKRDDAECRQRAGEHAEREDYARCMRARGYKLRDG